MRVAQHFCLVTAVLLGAGASVGNAAPLLTVTAKTTPITGIHGPVNCVAMWIEKDAGDGVFEFVETIGRWCAVETRHLVAWQAAAGLNDIDAVSGATRPDHSMLLTVTWDLKDKLGVLVPDGVYRVRIETTDSEATTAAQNWQAGGLNFPLTFTKGLTPDVQMPIDPDAHYTDVSVKYDPTALECNNNVVDPGETCDPPGSCPVDCEPSGDVCAPNVVVGSAATCTAACAIVPITTCISGDGCCVEGCGPLEDGDCTDQDIAGGCTTGDSNVAPLAFGLLGAVLVFGRRRRR